MIQFMIVALGGALGAAARYGVNITGARLWGSDYPVATLVVNILGCFAMGLVTALGAVKLNLSAEWRLFLTTGVLGGFTTFSAFALDFAMLFERRDYLAAGGYAAASVGLSLAALFAGLALARAVA